MPRTRTSRLGWLYLCLVVLVWLLGEWVAERTIPTLLLAYAPPVLWLLPAPVVLLWNALRRKNPAPALVATLLAAGSAELLLWHRQSAGELRVLTYNVARGTQSRPQALAQTLKQANADIILLQEANFVRPDDLTVIRSALPGYRLARAYEVTTLTRLPLLHWEDYDLPQNHREVLLTTVRWRGKPLHVVNVHLGTVMLSPVLRGDFDRVRRTRAARNAQLAVVKAVAAPLQGPVLVAGDFNTPPRGRYYRQLERLFGPDAHDAAGRRAGWTFPSLKLRIDHAFARGLTPTATRVIQARGSDHLPLLVEFRTK